LENGNFDIFQPLETLPAVGRVRGALFAKIDILTVHDLLFRKPRRYEDRRQRDDSPWDEGGWKATRMVLSDIALKHIRGGRVMVEGSGLTYDGQLLHLRWFNIPYLAKQWQGKHPTLCVFGKLKKSGRKWIIDMPEWEALEDDAERTVHVDRIVPVYSLTEGLSQRVYRGLIYRFLKSLPASLPEWNPYGQKYGDWRNALRYLHFPNSLTQAEMSRRRLAFDEFLVWQTLLAIRRSKMQVHTCPAIPPSQKLVPTMLDSAGFTPTPSQEHVLSEIATDIAQTHPMNRLLQGDVGSGKTLVALIAMLHAVEAGHAAALMAPTEILAKQHYLTFKRFLKNCGLTIGLLTGSTKTQSGDFFRPHIWIGTHALFQKNVDIPNLALVVVDEQHKFGVEQRARLRSKGESPHVLVMTATPIPRTLGLTLYGDLDVSVIERPPKGRGSITTVVRQESALEKIWDFVKARCDEKQQAYVVYPVISENKSELKAVEKEISGISKKLSPHRVEALHGRMDATQKEALMEDFRAGKVAVLVSTTVIEVGVDVPNASVMVVENAERFGLAQLHQLRGRIGRGSHRSYCVLVSGTDNPESLRRLEILAKTGDGFRIAEVDLQLRGAGDALGKMQSGAAPFRLGNLTTDLPLISAAQTTARKIIGDDPKLALDDHLPLRVRVRALAKGYRLKFVDAA